MITVACVLKDGGRYDARWVRALRRGVSEHLPLPHRFVCLTDVEYGEFVRGLAGPGDLDTVEYLPLVHAWPGYWCLVEWWTPGLFAGRVIAMGLDTLPVGDLSDLAAYAGPMAGIDEFNQPAVLASGVMAWTGGEGAELYSTFVRDSESVMRRYPRMDPWMRTVIPGAERLQRHYPGQVVSYKVHCLRREAGKVGGIEKDGPPPGARLVCFHGKPAVTDLDASSWARRLWEHRAGGTR